MYEREFFWLYVRFLHDFWCESLIKTRKTGAAAIEQTDSIVSGKILYSESDLLHHWKPFK